MNTDNWMIQSAQDVRIARSRATTRRIADSDRGKRTEELDLALSYDENTRLYTRR